MRKFPGRAAVLTAAVVAGLTVSALGATGASAATAGQRDGGFQDQVFVIHQEGVNATTGDVRAFGPIQGRGIDIVQSETTDLFVFHRGSVYVDHKAVSDSKPVLDFRACTATIDETGTWKLDPPGTGKYERARGWGTYDATIVLGFRSHRHGGPGDTATAGGDRHHRCHIDLNSQPKTSVVDVTATGQVSLGHHHRR